MTEQPDYIYFKCLEVQQPVEAEAPLQAPETAQAAPVEATVPSADPGDDPMTGDETPKKKKKVTSLQCAGDSPIEGA